MSRIETIEQLEALYGVPGESSVIKVTRELTPDYQVIIERSRFAVLATCGPEGLDCSPRGDVGSVARVQDERTLLVPDRRGNNRVDSLRNIVRDPRVAMLFMMPGQGTTLRVNGKAYVSAASELLETFSVDDQSPRSVVVISVEEAYFQCARAIVRSELWNSAAHIPDGQVPSAGDILANLSNQRIGGQAYDREWPERARKSLW